jgi:hypothetical protein
MCWSRRQCGTKCRSGRRLEERSVSPQGVDPLCGIYQILWSVFEPCSILRTNSMKYTADIQSELECCESCWRASLTLFGTQRLNSEMRECNLHEEPTKIKTSFGGRLAEGVWIRHACLRVTELVEVFPTNCRTLPLFRRNVMLAPL